MSNNVDFLEDKSILKPLQKEHEIKGFSIEGWFYKKFSTSPGLIKLFLIGVSLLLIGLSIRFILLAYVLNSEDRIREDFENQIINTQLR